MSKRMLKAKDLLKQGENLVNQAQYEYAIECFEKARIIFEKEGDQNNLLYCLLNLAIVQIHKGNYPIALERLEKILSKALKSFLETDDILIKIYNVLAITHGRMGNHKRQYAYYQKALSLLLSNPKADKTQIALCYNNLGVYFYQINNWGKAVGYFEKSVAMWKQLIGKVDDYEVQRNLAWGYNNIGNCLTHEPKEQLKYYENALEIRLEIYGERHPDVAMSFNSIGISYSYFKQYDKALSFLKKAIEIGIATLGKDHLTVAQYYVALGRCYYTDAFRDFEKALDCFHQTLRVYEAKLGENNYFLAKIYNDLGYCYLNKDAPKNAIEYYHKGLYSLASSPFQSNLYHNPVDIYTSQLEVWIGLLSGKANAFLKLYFQNRKIKDLQMAFDTMHHSLEVFHQKNKNHSSKIDNFLWANYTGGINKGAVRIAYEMQLLDSTHLQSCLYFIEQTKGMILLASIQESNAKITSDIPPSWQEEEQSILSNLNKLDKQIRKGVDKGLGIDEKELDQIKEQRFDLQQVYERLILEIEKNYPRYHQLKYDVKTATIEGIQKHLVESQLLINYYTTSKGLYILVIGITDVFIHRVDLPSNFDQLIRNFNKGINRLDLKKYTQTAHQLYQILLAPVFQHPTFTHSVVKHRSNRTIGQLIIIPHELLSTIPFEALLCSLPEENQFLQYADLDYLLLHYDVVYHYSATLWWQGVKDMKGSKLEESFVGFAPVYQGTEPQKEQKGTKEVMLSTEYSQHQKEFAGMRSVKIGEKNYQALLYSEAEVKGVQVAFETKQLPQSIFLHEQATKINFEKAVKGKKYVLIAAHGFYNKVQPELSGIIFSPENVERSEEAVLYVNDAYHLDLKQTDLVVLSACESGIGKLAKGEGMMAINRGFLYSGAKNVIFTLFKVYDAQSSRLTQALFRYILEGKRYSQALRLAKLELIHSGDLDPKAWAGFVLIGG